MTKIGVLSDTHGHLHPKIFSFFSTCHEIWHAGDIGNIETAERLAEFKPLRAVYGNIDDTYVRARYPLHQQFMLEKLYVWITHIGGYPGKYDKSIINNLQSDPPDLFICGHSHILKVIYDKKLKLLHINPGAAGKFGIHQISTAIRFDIKKQAVHNLEILEFSKKG